MRRIALALGLGLVLALSLPVSAGDWEPLFNGKDQTGWMQRGEGGFVIEEGALVSQGGMGLLWYEARALGDVELRIVYKTEHEKTNSGVFVRLPGKPDPTTAAHEGYEIQIDDSGADDRVTGVLFSLTETKARPGKPGDWNEMLVTLDGDRTVVVLNGETLTDYTEGDPVLLKKAETDAKRGRRPTEGYLALQNRGDGHTILFKTVEVRSLK